MYDKFLLRRQIDPKTFPPRSATLNCADADHGEGGQFTRSILRHVEGLNQGMSLVLTVSPIGRFAGEANRHAGAV